MPNPVCVTCSAEMKPGGPVVVQFNAHVTKGAYEQRHGDLYSCPSCGVQVVSGYGDVSWRHFQGAATREEPTIIVEERSYRGPRRDAPSEIR